MTKIDEKALEAAYAKHMGMTFSDSNEACRTFVELYEAAKKQPDVDDMREANEMGSCPDHCVALACEVVWQAAKVSQQVDEEALIAKIEKGEAENADKLNSYGAFGLCVDIIRKWAKGGV